MNYGLLYDCGEDSFVYWFPTLREAIQEFLTFGGELNSTDPSGGTWSIVKKVSQEDIRLTNGNIRTLSNNQ